LLASIFSGWDDLIVAVVAVVVLFGGTQLPKLARNAGTAMREFRKGHSEAFGPQPEVAASVQPAAPAAQPAVPAVPLAAGVQATEALPRGPVGEGQPPAAPASAPGEERVTLTRAELDALLADREARARASQPGGAAGN
jgi:sec-independent protein translocase protein TatA